jgi:hypothetical protein
VLHSSNSVVLATVSPHVLCIVHLLALLPKQIRPSSALLSTELRRAVAESVLCRVAIKHRDHAVSRDNSGKKVRVKEAVVSVHING